MDISTIWNMFLEKIKNEFNLLGYYSIITSETEMSDKEIIDTYHNLVEIEDEYKC